MRAIDADAMIKDLEQLKGQSPELNEVLDLFIKLLKTQPTIGAEKGVDRHDKREAAPLS